ncbi:MAG: hypothetical protein WC787_00550 [Patescibacteria group bacterium]|jgi:hypothetical protein
MPRGEQQSGHPEVWAFLTIITFPIVLIASDLFEVGGWWPFLYALLATFSILVLEVIVRGRLWPFEKEFVNHIGHPETPYRILVFLGATLLMLETVVVVGVATDTRFDAPLLGLIINKQCAARGESRISDSICRFLTESKIDPQSELRTADLSRHALLLFAEKAWFPNGGHITCVSRPVVRTMEAENTVIRELNLIHCVEWKIDTSNALSINKHQTRYAAAALARDKDGFPVVTSWSEDSGNASWETTLGNIAAVSRDKVESLGILPELIPALDQDALEKAQSILKR